MNETDMQHGLDWGPEVDPTGWLASEKFNGCRAYWDGQTLWSRGGIAIRIPPAWQAALPQGIPLDGEVYDGPNGLTRCTSAVRWGRFRDSMTYRVFDFPGSPLPWQDRISLAGQYAGPIIQPVAWWSTKSTDHLRRLMHEIQSRGGEGVMLRHPMITTAPGRTDQLLKAKYPFQLESPPAMAGNRDRESACFEHLFPNLSKERSHARATP